MKPYERRHDIRFSFERGVKAQMMAIDGTWRINCIMEDISDTGVGLAVQDSLEGLKLDEFFLMLSLNGAVHRHCELSWVRGNQIGATFKVRRTPPGSPH